MPYYHVTTKENFNKIKTTGLIPQIGPRSRKADEPIPFVYLFISYDDMEDGITNWLGDQFNENEELVCLEIKLPQALKQALVSTPNAEFETKCPVEIPCKYITPLEINL